MGNNLLGPILQAGSEVGSALLSAFSGGRMNRKQRQHQKEMYGIARQDALSDWHMQNAYNDPSAQMMRLKNAGLNPNLVYGNGVVGNSGDGVRGSSPSGFNGTVPDWSGIGRAGNVLMQAADFEIKRQTVDNMEAQNELTRAEIVKKAAETMNLGYTGEHSKFDLEMKNALRENSLQVAEAALRKTEKETDVLVNRDAREAARNASDLREATMRIASMSVGMREAEARMRNMGLESDLRALELEMKKLNIYPGDPWYVRVAALAARKLADSKPSGSSAATRDRTRYGQQWWSGFSKNPVEWFKRAMEGK